jgi:Sec-independent protein translocase protein TatA
VFGIGMQEMVIIGLVLLIFSVPKNLPGMARDFGRFLGDARRSVEGFKEDLVSEKEGDQEFLVGQYEPEAGENLEKDVERKVDEVPPNASSTG